MPLYPLTERGQVVPHSWRLVVEQPRGRDGQRRRAVRILRGVGEKQARRELARLEAQAREGQVARGRLTVGDLFDAYLAEHAQHTLAPYTVQAYRVALSEVRARVLRAVPVSKLARYHLAAHEAQLRQSHTRRGGRVQLHTVLSPVSVARYLNPVKSALEWAESVELLPASRNPARTWKIAQHAPPERPALDREQAQRYLQALAGSPWQPHLLTLLSTGLRLSELRGLRWQDVDLETGALRVRQQWQRVHQLVTLADGTQQWRPVEQRREKAKSRAGQRDLGLPHAVCAVLREWKRQQNATRLAAGRGWRDPPGGALVFALAPSGQPFPPPALRHAHYTLLREAQLPRIGLHDLRHSFVTLALSAGVPDYLVPQLAGHSREVEAKVYRHTTAAAGRSAAARLWDYLTEATGTPTGTPTDAQEDDQRARQQAHRERGRERDGTL